MGTASRRALACVLAVALLGCSCVERRVANLVSPNRFVRNRAHRKLRHLGKGQQAEAVRVLCEVVRGRSHLLDNLPGRYPLALRIEAAELLLRLKDPSADPTLIWALEAEESGPLREYAARGLASSEDPRALAALEHATHDAYPNVRAAAVKALYGRKGSEDVAALARIFEDDPAPRVRKAVVRSLERSSSPEAVPILLAASRDSNREVRRWFAYIGRRLALRGLGEKEITDAYVRLLSDPNHNMAEAACDALRYIGNRRAVPALAAALDERGLRAAARALGSLPDLRALPALARALGAEDAGPRNAAASALASYGRYAVEHLTAALRDEENSVRRAVAESLATIRTVGAVETLLSAMFEADQPLRGELLKALGSLTHDPRSHGWSRDRWGQWWDEAEPRFEGLDAAPERVASRSGEYVAVIRRDTISLLDREGNVLWTKLIGRTRRGMIRRLARVSDLGWVLFCDRFISQTGTEPPANPVRTWLPGESYARATAAEVSPDGRHAAVLVTAGEKSALVLCDEQGRALWKEPCPRGVIPVFAPDGRYIACVPGIVIRCMTVGRSYPPAPWALTLFSREGVLLSEIPVIPTGGSPGWIPARAAHGTDVLPPRVERLPAGLRGCGALDCTALGLVRRGPNRPPLEQAGDRESGLPLLPWDMLASPGGVLVESGGGLFLLARRSAPKLVGRLSNPDLQTRKLSFEVLRKMAGRSFGYLPDAPEAERAPAIERWRNWAEGSGKTE